LEVLDSSSKEVEETGVVAEATEEEATEAISTEEVGSNTGVEEVVVKEANSNGKEVSNNGKDHKEAQDSNKESQSVPISHHLKDVQTVINVRCSTPKI
jgi:hypothetical protein